MNVIILAGGLGSRLWPISNSEHAKPLLCITDGHTLIQKTFIRAIHCSEVKEIIVVTNSRLFLSIQANLTSIKKIYNSIVRVTFIVEQENKGTCAAIALAILYKKILEKSEDEIVTIMPSDHMIDDDEVFYETLKKNIKVANQNNSISILAVMPKSDNSSYGYIVAGANGNIISFIEKPDILTLNKIRSSSRCYKLYWNTGIFSCSIKILLEEMRQHYMSSFNILQKNVEKAKIAQSSVNKSIKINSDNLHQVDNMSIDKIILENSTRLTYLSSDMKWTDIGCWQAVSEFNNAKEGSRSNIIMRNSQNCYIKVSPQKTVACIGIRNVAIVDTENALLVTDLNSSQQVGSIYDHLETRKL